MSSEETTENENDLRNDMWVESNMLALIQEYPGEWIAVIDQRVIAKGKTKREADSNAKEKSGDQEFSLYFVPKVPPEADAGYTQGRR